MTAHEAHASPSLSRCDADLPLHGPGTETRHRIRNRARLPHAQGHTVPGERTHPGPLHWPALPQEGRAAPPRFPKEMLRDPAASSAAAPGTVRRMGGTRETPGECHQTRFLFLRAMRPGSTTSKESNGGKLIPCLCLPSPYMPLEEKRTIIWSR